MRYLYISFFLCLIAGKGFSQTSVDSVTTKGDPGPLRLFIRCQATMKDDGPLFIADGVLVDSNFIRKISPDDIESIDILKDSYAAAIYGSPACNGVIIITTKAARMRQFLVKDLLEGDGVSGATLTFISLKDERDSLRFAADEQGIVKTTLLKPGEEYKIVVSSVGYKPLSETYKNTSPFLPRQFLLERDVKENIPVVVISGVTVRCRLSTGCYATISYTSFIADLKSNESLSTRIYPNPLRRGNIMKLEIDVQKENPLQIRIANLNGSGLRLMTYHPFKGMNRIEVPTESQWAAGIYFIQILDEKGKLLKQDKLLIQ